MFEARFQSFDDPTPAATGPRVEALRAELDRRGLSGFILPRADRHQNEYVPPSEERLAWLTGFTGSAGAAAGVAPKDAAVFVRGRTLPARGGPDVGAAQQGRAVRRRTLHAAGCDAGRRVRFHGRADRRDDPGKVDRAE